MTTLALLHPGEMGAAVGACALAAGARVVWASDGRGEASRKRAADAGFEDAGDLAGAVGAADIVLSVCPPHGATRLAREVAALGFRGVYLDANAIAPSTARHIGNRMTSAGAVFIDGGIVGAPPGSGIRSCLYVSGGDAACITELFAKTPLEVRVLDGGAGAASALKACYAAWNKGATALLANIRALAVSEGVEAEVVGEWQRGQPDAIKRSEHACSSAYKAWRWIGEMDEIATTFRDAGLPDGFHAAASDIFRRLESFKDAPVAPDMAALTGAILGTTATRR